LKGFTMPLISVRNLSVAYADTPAVRDVSFDIDEGGFIALVGESGSGKSTISNAILGLLPITATVTGSIQLDGRELIGLTEKQLAGVRGPQIGLVPQDPGTSLNPVLTIGRQISEVFTLHADPPLSKKERWKRSVDLLNLVGVDRPEIRMRQYPHELSGGMKQRVLIAIAFGLNPRLIVADEPTSALDVTVQRQVLDVFDRLVADLGTAVLFVTHDLAVATDHADEVVVMQQGRVVEHEPVERIVHGARHEYTRVLLDAASMHFRGSEHFREEERTRVTTPEVSVRARDLVKVFATRSGAATTVTAVDQVSFDIRKATTFSLVGESGSGKSTTARLILGLTPPTSGTVHVNEATQHLSSRKARRGYWRNIQYVYQNPQAALDPRYTVARVISEPLTEYGIGNRQSRKARVAELLDRVRLPQALAKRHSRDLSGGQQQRVAIARALALGAEVIVLDEALSALDVVTQAQILELLHDLQEELRLTYLFISHDLAVVRQVSDDVGVLRGGRLVETGAVRDIFGNPQHEYTQTLLSSIPGDRYRDALSSRNVETVGAA
jgi:peptide/nickel transport system ATP-binding protein